MERKRCIDCAFNDSVTFIDLDNNVTIKQCCRFLMYPIPKKILYRFNNCNLYHKEKK